MASGASLSPLHRWKKSPAPATIGVNVGRVKCVRSRQAAVNLLALKQPQNAIVAVTQQDATGTPTTHIPPRRTAVIFQTTNHSEDAKAATAPESANQNTICRWRYVNVRPIHPLPVHPPFQARDTTPPVHHLRQHHAPIRWSTTTVARRLIANSTRSSAGLGCRRLRQCRDRYQVRPALPD
ncbi:hypothetical protein Pdw03_6609 [Penicillium digitatum]|uniref:Uncharacterized protein n=3 Tax=Penicillium digitatum TaxID=36651 RepID=K9GC72_PEND2|nr:hypothetical protein PDIP_34850 [Penicillium digitatum Pd1]EKV12438.1 hypothetical protein PDIG_43620 [Penicillium digitatum PHI26]EKV16698.1 hypothetical protein PDIP_34850 [Penicillium digitatum Pd1]QQK42708.1 hypothetical protein Pdw03_6609 [Penicillium digitatum]